MSIALVWLRCNLRLADHPSLHRAATAYRYIIPVYIPKLARLPAPALHQS
ncbi:MAG: deoxyribodipyrimidine photo-lyase [Candidatus Competibacter sp.]